MGMSASQMRYVLLTGKKSDVEYQGQQINQQRTTLATESAAFNTQLLTLQVPTPPSSDQYTKTTYTMAANGQAYTVTGVQYQAASSDYTVFLTNDTITSKGKSSGSSLFSSSTVAGVTTYMTSQGTVLKPIITDSGDPDYDSDEAIIDRNNTAKINEDTGATGPFLKYTSNGVTKYVPQSSLEDYANTTTAIPTFFVDENAVETISSKMTGAQVTWNESNRMTSITDSTNNTFSLNVATVNDIVAYDDAFNEYEFKKAEYDKAMNDINAKICVIESQDKKLELKLKDLDTQQEAIQTEMDSVKKVVDKNIEQSFKAFA